MFIFLDNQPVNNPWTSRTWLGGGGGKLKEKKARRVEEEIQASKALFCIYFQKKAYPIQIYLFSCRPLSFPAKNESLVSSFSSPSPPISYSIPILLCLTSSRRQQNRLTIFINHKWFDWTAFGPFNNFQQSKKISGIKHKFSFFFLFIPP